MISIHKVNKYAFIKLSNKRNQIGNFVWLLIQAEVSNDIM